MLGYRPEEVEPHVDFFKRAIHPDDLPVVLDRLNGHLEGRTASYESEHRLRSKSGAWIWVMDRGRITEIDKAGSPVRVTGVISNIHERKRAELQAQENLKQFKYVLETTSDGYWNWNIQTGSAFYSPQWLRLLGYAEQDAPERMDFFHSIVHPDDLQRMTVAVQDHLEGRRPSKEVNVRLRMNSGEYRWVWARGKVVEWDGTSSPLLMVGTISDIHEQLQAAESLQRTQFVVDTALEAIFWIDSAGRFTYVNEEACRSLNSSREELLKLSVFDIDADFTEDKWPARMEAIRKGTLPTQEFRHRTRDGRIFPVEIATSYHMFGDREFTCSFARDISKRKRMECVMEALTVSLAGLTGQAYLTGALQSLADLTGAEVVMITDFSFSDEDKLHMIACWKDGQLLQEMKYQMSGTPCERVARERFFTCQSGVADLFPGAKHLRDWEIESYAGARIADRSGNFIGVLAVMGRRPLSNLEEVRSTLNLFALSAAAELARQRNSAQLREVFDSAPDFMLMIDQKGRIISVNHASMQMLGYSEEDLIGQPMEMLVPEQLRQKHAQLQDDYFRQPRLRFMGEPGMALHVRKKMGNCFRSTSTSAL